MNINDLPNEMILEILEKLSPSELVNASKTCLRWRNLIASLLNTQSDQILQLASQSRKFKGIIQDKGWTGTDDEPELILSLYHHTYASFSSKSQHLKYLLLSIIHSFLLFADPKILIAGGCDGTGPFKDTDQQICDTHRKKYQCSSFKRLR